MAYTLEQHQQALVKAQEAGDDAAVERISQKIHEAHAGAYEKAAEAGDIDAVDRIATKYRETRKDWSRESAVSDPVWISNAKTLYNEVEKKPYEGDDKGAAEWLKGYMSDFNYRLLGSESVGLRNTIGIAASVKDFSPKGKAAFLTAMDDFDALPTFSSEGAYEAGKRILTDPSTVIGIGGLGAGEAAVQGAKQAAKMGVKQLVKAGVKRAAVRAATGAVEGATASAVEDSARQEAEIGAGREDEFDPMRTAKAAGKGAVAGAVVGGVTGGISAARATRKNKVSAIASDKINENSDRAAMEAEHVLDIRDNLTDPTKRRNFVTVKETNAIARDYADTAVALANRTKAPRAVKEQIKDAARNPRATKESELVALEQASPEGAAVASAIRKMKLSESLTARDDGADNFVKKGIRLALDLQTHIPPIFARGIQQTLRAPNRSELINQNVLSKRNLAVAEEVLKRTGPSSASTGIETLKDRATRARLLDEANEKVALAAKDQAKQAKVASENLQKEGFDLLQEKDLGPAADWLDANRDNLTAGQYKSFANQLINKKKALDKAQAKSPSGNNAPPRAPRAPQSSRAGIPDPEPIRMKSQYNNATDNIRGMQERVLEDAALLPDSKDDLRGAMEDYIHVLDTVAKRDPEARKKAYEAATKHLSKEDKKHFDAHPDIKKLKARFKVKMSAEEAERRGAARKKKDAAE